MKKPKSPGNKPRHLTSEYSAWYSMMHRCYNPKNAKFHRYGGRGILVCERWQKIENFLTDMGKKSSHKLTLERIDNDKGYDPSNCRWATYSDQNKNRSRYWHKDTLLFIEKFK